MPAYFVGKLHTCLKTPSGRRPTHKRATDKRPRGLINEAFKQADVAEICHAIGAVVDLAQKSGLARASLHRAFAADP